MKKFLKRELLFSAAGMAVKKISKMIKKQNRIILDKKKFKKKSTIEINEDNSESYVIPVEDFYDCVIRED